MRVPADLSSVIRVAGQRADTGQRPPWHGPAPDGVLEATPEAIACMDDQGTLVWVNREVERLFGYAREELLGQPVETLLPWGGRCAITEAFRRANPRPKVGGRVAKLTGHRSDGSWLSLEVTLGPLYTEQGFCAVVVMRVPPAPSAKAEHTHPAEDLENALRDERDRIARDLHDGVAQRLFASTMAVQGLRASVTDPTLDAQLARLVDDLDRSNTEIRNVIYRLTPPGTAEGELRSDLMGVLDEERAVLGLSPSVRFIGDLETPDAEWRHQVVSIFRELLSNVARHAHAAHVEVDVRVADQFVLRVSDDGVGFDLGRATLGRGVRNITQRAHALGGSVEFRHRNDGGTEVECSVPIPSPSPGACTES